jgi:hypothetical protein
MACHTYPHKAVTCLGKNSFGEKLYGFGGEG